MREIEVDHFRSLYLGDFLADTQAAEKLKSCIQIRYLHIVFGRLGLGGAETSIRTATETPP